MTKGAQGGVAVARVEEGRRDAAEVPRPDEVIHVVAVVIHLTPGRRRRGDKGARVRLVFEAVEQGERGAREHALVTADLLESAWDLGLRVPRAFEGLANSAGALLQCIPRDLFGVRPRVCESDRQLERTCPHAEARPHPDISAARAVLRG